jgi:hypothetical protein
MISDIVKAVSDQVVAQLAALPTPIVLTDGQILCSRKHVFEQSSPNRIVFIPARSTFSARDVSSASPVATSPTAEAKSEWLSRSIATDTVSFVVQCWGQANPPDPDGGDFDVAQALYQQTILACHALMCGRVEFTPGDWIDQDSSGTQLIVAGHVFEFGVTIETPVVEAALSFVPDGTKVEPTAYLVIDGGTPATP